MNAGSDLPTSPPPDPGNITRILNDHTASHPEALAAVAPKVMRQILIDYARRRRTVRRSGAPGFVPLAAATDHASTGFSARNLTDLITLDHALERLATLSPRQAKVVECRFFGGMSVEETTAALDVSRATVKRDWSVARAWLNHAMAGDEAAEET